MDMSAIVLEEELVPPIDVAFKSTPSRWWVTHKEYLREWKEVQPALWHHFNVRPEYKVIDIHVV